MEKAALLNTPEGRNQPWLAPRSCMVQWLTLSLPRILVVDDNPELLTLLSSSFEEAGYAVAKANRGRSALDLARKEKPALAIVDILLPDLMGYDVAEVLKRMKIPFILISGVHKGGTTAKGAASLLSGPAGSRCRTKAHGRLAHLCQHSRQSICRPRTVLRDLERAKSP